MKLHDIAPKNPKKDRKRKGQGNATGNGTYAGRGMNGQNARAGGGVRQGFEGGQTPLIQRMPKMRGFNNPNRVENQEIDLGTLEQICKAGDKVDRAYLIDKGLVHHNRGPVKVLASGELTKKISTEGIKTSKGAQAAIEKAGGTVTAPVPREKVLQGKAKREAEAK